MSASIVKKVERMKAEERDRKPRKEFLEEQHARDNAPRPICGSYSESWNRMSSSSMPPRWRRAGSVEEEANWEAARLEQTQQSQPHASPWALLLLLSAVDNSVTIFIFYFSYFTNYLAKKKKKENPGEEGEKGAESWSFIAWSRT